MILSIPATNSLPWYSAELVAKGLALAVLAACMGSVYPLLLGDMHTREVLAAYGITLFGLGFLAVSALTIRGMQMNIEEQQRSEAVRMVIYVAILASITIGIIDMQLDFLRLE